MCQKLALRCAPDDAQAKDINGYLEVCQHVIMASESTARPFCVHRFDKLHSLQPFEIIETIMTSKQILIYSKNCMDILNQINVFELKKITSIGELIDKLRITSCQRSFIISYCIFRVFTIPFLSSGKAGDISEDITPSVENLALIITRVRLNSIDSDYVRGNAGLLLTFLCECLVEGRHLRCSATLSADSATCACGIKCHETPPKAYIKLMKKAQTKVNLLLEYVRGIVLPTNNISSCHAGCK